MLSKKGQSYDFAVLGSSRALNNVSVPEIEYTLNVQGINLGLSGANYAENYMVLREFLNNGNKLGILYIQADIYGMDSPNAYSYPFNDYNYVFLLGDDTVADVFKDHINPLKYYMWKYIPYAKYAEFSNKYSFYKYLKKGYICSADDWDKNSGSELLGQKKVNEEELFKVKKVNYSYKVNTSDSLYLDKIISYCIKKNIQVRLFTAPEKKAFVNQQGNRNTVYTVINAVCLKNKIPSCYTDFNSDEINLHFRDNTHLDSTGTKIFSSFLAKKIKTDLSTPLH